MQGCAGLFSPCWAPTFSTKRQPAPRIACMLNGIRLQQQARRSVRCNVQPGVDRRRNLPVAPPARAPPPPPPPPPPPEEIIPSGINMSRGTITAIIMGGALALWLFVNSGVPLAGVDRDRNLALLRTAGGNTVVATQDERGRVFLFDRTGNIYYDSEDPAIGMYIVTRGGEMFNKYLDKDGTVQTKRVGNMNDMVVVELGNDMRRLQAEMGERPTGTITGFFAPTSEEAADYRRVLTDGKGNPAIVEDFVVRPKNEGQRLADQDKRAVVESFDKSLKGQ